MSHRRTGMGRPPQPRLRTDEYHTRRALHIFTHEDRNTPTMEHERYLLMRNGMIVRKPVKG